MNKGQKIGILVISLVLFSLMVFVFPSCSQPPEEDVDTTDTTIVEPDTAEVADLVPSLEIDALFYLPGDEILVTYVASEDFEDNAWVGVIPSNVPHGDEEECDEFDIDFHLIGGELSGTMIFYSPEELGSYDIRMFDSDFEGTEIASVTFAVVDEIPANGEEVIEEEPVEEEPVEEEPVEEETTEEPVADSVEVEVAP